MLKPIENLVLPTDIDMDATPSSTLWGGVIGWQDNEDSNYPAYTQVSKNTNGRTNVTLASRNVVNGSNVSNQLQLYVDKDGTRGVALNQAPWLAALGLASKTVSGTNAFNVASGFTLNSAWLVTAGPVAMLYVTATKTAAAAVSTEYTVGTIANAATNKPKINAAAVATARNAVSLLRSADGQLRVTPLQAYGAGTTFYFCSTFIPTSWT